MERLSLLLVGNGPLMAAARACINILLLQMMLWRHLACAAVVLLLRECSGVSLFVAVLSKRYIRAASTSLSTKVSTE